MVLNGRLNAAVESEIVGYTTIEMEANKWYQVGCPFDSLNGESITVNTVFTNTFASGDVLTVYNPESGIYSDTLYWHDGLKWTNNIVYSFAKTVNLPLEKGQAVFIKKGRTPTTVIFSGKVNVSEVKFGKDGENVWSQIYIPWPETVMANDLEWTNMGKGDVLTIYDFEEQKYSITAYWHDGLKWTDNIVRSFADPIDIPIKPGQALFINKGSKKEGAVNLAQ